MIVKFESYNFIVKNLSDKLENLSTSTIVEDCKNRINEYIFYEYYVELLEQSLLFDEESFSDASNNIKGGGRTGYKYTSVNMYSNNPLIAEKWRNNVLYRSNNDGFIK